MTYCPDCGTEIKYQSQKFCEKCGCPIPSVPSTKQSQESSYDNVGSAPSLSNVSLMGSIFDINRNYYIIKETVWDMGFGDILDERGTLIGKMNRKIFSVRRRVEIQEVDGTVQAVIHEKIVSARQAQTLMDPAGNVIAKIKKKILTVFHHKYFLEDPLGNRWYEADGNFMGWSFKIVDCSTGKLVAEIEKADRWRDVFLRGLFDFKDTYALRIYDNETDRRILLGFVLSIDNTLYDNHGRTTMMGGFIGPWGRPIGRRRPGGIPGPFRGGFPKRPF